MPIQIQEISEDCPECPLCMESLEVDDINFFPCVCGYQICRFCWHRIRTDENGLCPACRTSYPEDPAEFKPLSGSDLQKIRSEKRQKELQRRQKLTDGRRHLANMRVLQKNLVFVIGLSQRLSDQEVLKRHEYFGKYGKIMKVVINTNTTYAGTQGPSSSAYVTYSKMEEALRAIQSVNNVYIDGRTLKASLGTTKYCSTYLKNQQCHKLDCMYLHELAEEDASFTKEDMQVGKHQDFEQRLLNQLQRDGESSSDFIEYLMPMRSALHKHSGKKLPQSGNSPDEDGSSGCSSSTATPPPIDHEHGNPKCSSPRITTREQHDHPPGSPHKHEEQTDEPTNILSNKTERLKVDTNEETSSSSQGFLQITNHSPPNPTNCDPPNPTNPTNPTNSDPLNPPNPTNSDPPNPPNPTNTTLPTPFNTRPSPPPVLTMTNSTWVSEEQQPQLQDTIPIKSSSDWEAAFGFRDPIMTSQVPQSCKQEESGDDELGFDPWVECNKGLADLIAKESANTRSIWSSNNGASHTNPVNILRSGESPLTQSSQFGQKTFTPDAHPTYPKSHPGYPSSGYRTSNPRKLNEWQSGLCALLPTVNINFAMDGMQPSSVMSPTQSMMSSQPPMMSSQPPMMSSQPSMMSSQPSMMSSQPSMMTSQPSMMSSQPPMMSSQPPMMSSQPPMMSSQPSMMSSQPSMMSSQSRMMANGNRGRSLLGFDQWRSGNNFDRNAFHPGFTRPNPGRFSPVAPPPGLAGLNDPAIISRNPPQDDTPHWMRSLQTLTDNDSSMTSDPKTQFAPWHNFNNLSPLGVASQPPPGFQSRMPFTGPTEFGMRQGLLES